MASNPGDVEKAEAARTDYPHAKESKLATWLTRIFITSCVFGVFLDPLFLYIPLLNQDLKCLRLDNTIKIIALVSRSFTDLFYVGRIILQVCRLQKHSPSIRQFLLKKPSSKLINGLLDLFPEVSVEFRKVDILAIGKEIWRSSIIVDILAILPLPQVAIVILFPKRRLSGSFGMRIINFLVMGQYLPRVFRIYLSCKKAKKPFKGQIPLWVKGLLNLFLYILASHVLGAFWYFLAAQQIIRCWEYACGQGNGCGATTLDCHDHQTWRNITALNNLCPIDPPNATRFDFGIYLNVLQSGALWSTDYPLKFLNSFCWGLRNLSSLASNLEPSFHTWEIAFVAFISIIGLILFVYLIGNLQTYVLINTQSLEEQRRKRELQKKIEKTDQEVEKWLSRHGIPLIKKQKIMEEIKRDLEENSDFDVVREILSILSEEEINSCSRLSRLRKVPLLKDMDKGVLREISEKLKPKKYTPKQIIIKKDQTLEMMLFIVDGHVTIEKADDSRLELGPGNFYGEKLPLSLLWTSSSDAKPIINESVEAIDDVQALVLNATDMESISSKHKSIYKKLCMVTILKKVPLLKDMDKGVLREISEKLKPKKYAPGQIIIKKDQTLEMMLFIVDGRVTIGKADGSRSELGAGDFYGGNLLVVSWTSSGDVKPITDESIDAHDDVQALVLYATDMESISSKSKSIYKKLCMATTLKKITEIDRKVESWLLGHGIPLYRKHIIMEGIKRKLEENSDIDVVREISSILPRNEIESCSPLSRLKKVPLLKDMDEGVLREISEKLKPEKYTPNQIIIKKDQTLEMMLFIVDGHVTIVKEKSQLQLGAGDFYGEKLPLSVLWTSSSDAKPINESVQAIDDVQALVLYATDMESIGSKSKSHFKKLCTVTILKNVEIFQQMDEQVLKAISKRLKPMSFNANKYILEEKKPLNMMFFVVRGVVLIESESAVDVNGRKTVELGSFYGEELVHWVTTWVSHQTLPTKLPLSPDSALCPYHGGSVKILALKADDLKSALSDFTLPTDSDQPRDWLTILKNVERFKTMDEEVLKEICGYLELRAYEDAYIIQKDKPIKMMFFIMSGVVSVTDGSSKHYRNEEGRPNHSGDDLIEHWLQSKSTSVPAELPTSPFSFWAIGEVKVLVLKADDLAKVQPGDQIRATNKLSLYNNPAYVHT